MNQRNIKSGPASQASAPVTVINAPQVQIRKRLLSNSRRTIQSTNVMLLTKHLLNNTEVRQKNRASALNEGNITKNDLSLSLSLKMNFGWKWSAFFLKAENKLILIFHFIPLFASALPPLPPLHASFRPAQRHFISLKVFAPILFAFTLHFQVFWVYFLWLHINRGKRFRVKIPVCCCCCFFSPYYFKTN